MENSPRKLSRKIISAMQVSPVVFVNGPRQAGKTTLVSKLMGDDFQAEYVSFDNVTQMAAASEFPGKFLASYKDKLIIDEVQIVPEIFRELKISVDNLRMNDKQNSNGKFLLTGSTNIMALPKLSDPLVGRMSVKTLYPFSVCEVFGGEGSFVDHLFNADFSDVNRNNIDLNEAISSATFPEMSGKKMDECSTLFEGYLATILQRDVRFLAEIEKISMLPNLLTILAARCGSLINDADISRDVGLNPVTSRTYRKILQAMFLTFDVRPWYRNIGKRLVKSPKGYIIDTLLLCHLLEYDLETLSMNKPHLYGHVVENFVATELTKLLSFGDIRAKLMHFRTSDNKEIDFILERPNGMVAAIEVKITDYLSARDFKNIRIFKDLVSDDFACGIILYNGKDIVPFGDKMFAVPFDLLWV